MSFELRKATKTKARVRIGLSGPSGSGKTYSALLLAHGLIGNWDKICLIDTENGSGDLYDHLGPYNVITLESPFSPERYIEAIRAAEEAEMECVIIDSVTHEWEGPGGCLEINEVLASAKFKGNTWAAWSETTPRHRKFLEAIIGSKMHMITTARTKTEMIQTDDKKIKKVGTKEIQREGFEYELTLNLTIDRERHMALASKDRTKLFIDRDPFLITEKIGKELSEWASSGAIMLPTEAPDSDEVEKLDKLIVSKGVKRDELFKKYGVKNTSELKKTIVHQLVEILLTKPDAKVESEKKTETNQKDAPAKTEEASNTPITQRQIDDMESDIVMDEEEIAEAEKIESPTSADLRRIQRLKKGVATKKVALAGLQKRFELQNDKVKGGSL